MAVPVTIVAGFLGAGKTTLINRLLRDGHGLNITVLVNDFGAVNIDAELIVRRQREVMELSNGCVCCSIQSDLVAQLQQLFTSEKPPEYLLIEASGVSQPARIAAVFGYPQLRGLARLDAVVTLIDAANTGQLSKDSAALVRDQIEAADIILMTKTDIADQVATQALRDNWLLPDQPVFEVINGGVPARLLLDVRRGDISRYDDLLIGPGPEFSSACWESDKALPYEHLRDALKALPPSVYRAKGVLFCAEFPEERIAFQKVGARMTFEKLGPWADAPCSRIVAIGHKTGFDAGAFAAMIELPLDLASPESGVTLLEPLSGNTGS